MGVGDGGDAVVVVAVILADMMSGNNSFAINLDGLLLGQWIVGCFLVSSSELV